jgi:hypothetical protein
MARLDWIVSEVAPGTGFPNGNIILQNPRLDPTRVGYVGRTLRMLSATLHVFAPA